MEKVDSNKNDKAQTYVLQLVVYTSVLDKLHEEARKKGVSVSSMAKSFVYDGLEQKGVALTAEEKHPMRGGWKKGLKRGRPKHRAGRKPKAQATGGAE